ncbi:MAG: acyl-CoA dehydrogenase family protein [Balneolaceae bacterium]|nr:acyl-CoA dehydrogenase family protein [Balneolaceae bacterium]
MKIVKCPKKILRQSRNGYKVAMETLNEGRIGIGAQMIGIAQGAFNAALSYTQERKQFDKAISEFQGVQFQLAKMATVDRNRPPAGLQRRADEGE